MRMTELSPGIYKIRKKDYSRYGSKRNAEREIRLLRVVGNGEKRKYYLDQNTTGDAINMLSYYNDFEIVSKYVGDPQVSKPLLTISWVDENGDAFEWCVTNAWALRSVFDAMEWLKKPFQFGQRNQ